MAAEEKEESKEEIKADGCYTIISADDGSLPVKTEKQKQAMLKERKLFEMDSYLKYIENQTYKTEFIPVSFQQAQALKLYFRGMNVDENEYFSTLKQVINTAIHQLQSKSDNENSRFFIRMSTRSPKDACDKPLFRQKLLSLMTQRFTNSDGSLNEEYKDLNQRLIGLRECFSKVLCVSTCDQMLDLLSFSERCVSDLKRLIDHKHLLEEWNLFLVIREFEFIPICNEYRCFVHKSKLTAITQYFPHCYFPKKIKEKKEQIRKMIVDYYNNVFLVECSSLNKELTDSYILDLNVDVESSKILIIELNPFSITTGSGFFDWTKDKDIIYGDANCDYPEIRVRMEPKKHLSAVL